MVYSFHHFYYWLKGGVETGLAYRAKLFRELGVGAKFVFATPFPDNNIQHETSRLGFLDSEVIWMYSFFTDCKVAPCSYTLTAFCNNLGKQPYKLIRDDDVVHIRMLNGDCRYILHMTDENSDAIRSVSVLYHECLLRKDYYTYIRIYSEFYTPKNHRASLYLRRFYNEDGTTAYEELIDAAETGNEKVMYKFPDRVLYSREELVGYMMERLSLTKDDVVLIDGEPGNIDRSAFILNASPAKVGFIIHADHVLSQDEDTIQWYDIYSYAFMHPEKIDFFITNTELQSQMLQKQLLKFRGVDKTVLTIPASGIDECKYCEKRKQHGLITVGRLAPEKNTDMVIRAVVEARKTIPDLTLDIFGEGMEKENLQKLIKQLGCENYVKLCGFQKLENLYQTYDAYITASFIETLGITYLEAVGAGLPIVGFDIPYGAQVFIDEGKNGYRTRYGDVAGLAQCVEKLFLESDMEGFRKRSYELATGYLKAEVKQRWQTILNTEE